MQQLEIDFTMPIEHIENNPFSQKLFEGNMENFKGQCKTIMEALLRGERLTTTSALLNYGIGDLRRRIKDLKDNYQVKCIKERLREKRFKEWYIEDCR